ncbi:MAG: ABC transporter ATP-binding protein [Eubacteriales bacterium]|nr:ABC transporter ATP-binding protein [Eubacteriales bacterium]
MEPIIRTENLDVGYHNRAVISDVELRAMRGQVICLLGPNGAGKSTILRTLSGLLAPVSGAVQVEGIDLKKMKKKDIARKMSLVLTDQVAPSMTTVYELIAMGRTPYTNFLGKLTPEDQKIIDESLETVGASAFRERFFSELSDGEKQKVMIARALVQEPELIILDEPTSHLDIKHKVEVVRVLQKLANEKGITCILSLHDIDLALKGCQIVLLVHNGKIVSQGTPEDVVRDGVIQQLYEIRGAQYSELFGAIELKGREGNDIFVTGGNSSGIRLYRALSRKGYGLTSGILHENDADYQVAKSICGEVVSEKPFERICPENARRAKVLMQKARYIVDSGFPVGTENRENLTLLQEALAAGRQIWSVRSREECEALYGNKAENVCTVSSVTELFEKLETAG